MLLNRRRSTFSQSQLSRILQAFWRQRATILASFSLLITLAVYVFFATGGQWTSLPATSQYYDDLATAFRSGHLNLNIQPSAALLALPDPYDPLPRKSDPALKAFIDSVWDLSYYHGNFYLYWGPAPAILLLIVKLVYAPPVGDQVLSLLLSCGALVFQTLLLIRIWHRFLGSLPIWTLALGIMTAGLINPTAWMLFSSGIYEAAIFSGQFFLMAGIYFAYAALEKDTHHTGFQCAAAVSLGLAIASRVTLLGSAIFLTTTIFIVLIWQYSRGHNRTRLYSSFAAIGLPLVIVLAALGWYNAVRFGSITEIGLRYQLTWTNLNKIHNQLFSSEYVLPNLYNYTILPFQTLSTFPFIKAGVGVVPYFLDPARLDNYHSEEITGILFSAPFLLFILWPVTALMKWFIKRCPLTRPSDIILEGARGTSAMDHDQPVGCLDHRFLYTPTLLLYHHALYGRLYVHPSSPGRIWILARVI